MQHFQTQVTIKKLQPFDLKQLPYTKDLHGKTAIFFALLQHQIQYESMKVCIAEKPSVAKEIAQILGAQSRKNGYFEGNGYQVTWTFGHLCTLKEPDDYASGLKKWTLSSLPILPEKFGIKLINDKGIKKQFSIIEKLVANGKEVINCGDAGIEGEVIQRWVLAKARCKVPVKRLWISSLTEEAIQDGFGKLQDAKKYDLLYAAGNSRAIGDWLLGINATRLYTLKFANNRGVLSIGRVQTPTLSLIVERDNEINNFVPEKYWEIKTTYREVTFSCEKKKFNKKEEAEKLVDQCKDLPFSITDFSKKKGKEAPPKLLDLTGLQVECNKKHGFSAEETLKITQKLYEKKLLTYPRVDTVYLPNDMYPKIGSILKGLKPYEAFTETILTSKLPKRKQTFDDAKVTDHHAIIPTGVNPSGLQLQEKQVYDTVARRFIAAFYPDSIVSNTTAKGNVGTLKFKTTGKQILEDGWRVLYPPKNDNKQNDKSQILPLFEKGESGPHAPAVLEKQTTPPKPYTEATLLRAMETAGKNVEDEELRDAMKENGIGRPSTRANIIETLFKRKYIAKKRKTLSATQTGIDLIQTIDNKLLKSVELTGQWECKLRQIERGDFQAKQFVDEMKQMIATLTKEVLETKQQSISIATENENKNNKKNAKHNSSLNCPLCNSTVVKGKTAYGCLGYKNGCKFIVPFTIFGKKLSDKQLETLIQTGSTGSIAGFTIDGKTQKAKLSLTDTYDVAYTLSEPEAMLCPKCKKGTMVKGKSAYGCNRYKEGCSFIIPFAELREHYNTEELNPQILENY